MISVNIKKRLITSFILIFLLIIIYFSNFVMFYSLIVLGVFSFVEFSNILKKIYKNTYKIFFLNLIFIIYIFIFCYIFYFASNYFQVKVLLFCILFGCASSDMGGFIFGKIFKGPKLSKISPNKTISGSIGSVLFTIIVLESLIYYLTNNLSFEIFFIAIITSVACQIGDLFFSFLKRKAKIKDTGKFFPGHGGVLDRFDGIFLGLPIGLISTILIY